MAASSVMFPREKNKPKKRWSAACNESWDMLGGHICQTHLKEPVNWDSLHHTAVTQSIYTSTPWRMWGCGCWTGTQVLLVGVEKQEVVGAGVCSCRRVDRLFVSRQSDRCGKGAQGAIWGESVMEAVQQPTFKSVKLSWISTSSCM